MNQQLLNTRLARLQRISRNHPDRFCRVNLIRGAMEGGRYSHWLHDAEQSIARCRQALQSGQPDHCACRIYTREGD